MGELVAGGAIGFTFQVLYEAIKKARDRSLTTRCILDRLEATTKRIAPLVAQVDKLSKDVEDSSRKVIEDLKVLLEKAAVLVNDYAELRRRNLLKKFRYKRKIRELEASLRWMVAVDVQVNQWSDLNALRANMSEMNIKLDEITRRPTNCTCFKNNHCLSSQTCNQSIIKETSPSSEKIAECSSDGSKPKIDIHIGWSSEKQNKNHEIRFVVK